MKDNKKIEVGTVVKVGACIVGAYVSFKFVYSLGKLGGANAALHNIVANPEGVEISTVAGDTFKFLATKVKK